MNVTINPRLRENEVITLVQQAMQSLGKQYDLSYGLQPEWKGLQNQVPGREGKAYALWSVAFLTPPGPFDQTMQFLELDDATGRPLHILTGAGRVDL